MTVDDLVQDVQAEGIEPEHTVVIRHSCDNCGQETEDELEAIEHSDSKVYLS